MVKEIVKDTEVLSKPLERATKDDLYIIRDLVDTAKAHDNCLGLTANQIGYTKRIILVKNGESWKPFINPIIVKKSRETYIAEEGCLSLDGERKVKRHHSIRLAYQEENGKQRVSDFSGLMAEIIQHEVDHCNGILI